MRWRDKADDGTASELEVVDTFHSYVRPTWRPVLSQFCTDLTGITQVCTFSIYQDAVSYNTVASSHKSMPHPPLRTS